MEPKGGSKWAPAEDTKIIELRGNGMKWEDISKQLPGRSAISCRLHYQNYLERRSEWDEDSKTKLARLYERFRADIWARIAEEMKIPWRAAEAMHWQMGEHEIARRAGTVPFSSQPQEKKQQRQQRPMLLEPDPFLNSSVKVTPSNSDINHRGSALPPLTLPRSVPPPSRSSNSSVSVSGPTQRVSISSLLAEEGKSH